MASFEEITRQRLRRYRNETQEVLDLVAATEAATREFADRLFGGLEYVCRLARESGFDGLVAERGAERGTDSPADTLKITVAVRAGMQTTATFGLVPGAAAETDEALIHEELSRWRGEPSGYSGRVLGWSDAADGGNRPCQVFAVYRDGLWKTDGKFVARSRGRLEDPENVLNGFCLRIVGRAIDLAASTQGSSRNWESQEYSLGAYLAGEPPPTGLRWPR